MCHETHPTYCPIAFADDEGSTISLERSNILSDCGSDVIYGERELQNNREGLARNHRCADEDTGGDALRIARYRRGVWRARVTLWVLHFGSFRPISAHPVLLATIRMDRGERKLLALPKTLKANQDGTAFTIPHRTVAHSMGWDFKKYCNRRGDNTPNYRHGPIKHYLNDDRLAQLGIFLDFDANGLQVTYSTVSAGNTAS